jgi:hypothetical protein
MTNSALRGSGARIAARGWSASALSKMRQYPEMRGYCCLERGHIENRLGEKSPDDLHVKGIFVNSCSYRLQSP